MVKIQFRCMLFYCSNDPLHDNIFGMSQISRRLISKDTQRKIYGLFTEVISKTSSKEDVESLLTDFFTPTERVMLPKRLCIAYLLLHGYTHRQISSYLNVSFTTINKVSTVLANGGKGYRFVLDTITRKDAGSTMLNTIEKEIVSFLAGINIPSNMWKKLNRSIKYG